jgi:tetratricopeptide (TPR) repeat protein
MFDDDEEDDFADNKLNEDIEYFEAHLNGSSIGFLDSDRLEALIDHFLINGQYAKARAASELGNYHFTYNPLFNLRLAQSMSGLGLLTDALDILNQIEKTTLNNVELQLTKAAIFSQLRDPKNAIKYFKLALEFCEIEDRDDVYLDIAMEYQNMGDYKEACKILIEALKVNPQNEAALYEIAFCYDQSGNYEKAIKCYSNFIDENPYSFTAWYNLGNAFSKSENYEKALWAYDYSTLINPSFGPVHFNMGNAYLSLEKYHQAIEKFQTCIELDGEDAMALCYIGEAHEQLNEFELSRHYYQLSLELAPTLPEAWLGLGIIEDLQGNTKEGIVLIQKAMDFDPENAAIHHVLAGAYEKINCHEEADKYYQSSLSFDAEDEDCLMDYIAFKAKKSSMDAMQFLRIFTANNSNAISAVLEVNLNWMIGQKKQALELFTKCLSEDQDKAKQLFEINPSLLDDKDFVTLFQDE